MASWNKASEQPPGWDELAVEVVRFRRALQRGEAPCATVPVPERLTMYRSLPDLRRWQLALAPSGRLDALRRFLRSLRSVPEVVSCRVEQLTGSTVQFRVMTVVFDRTAMEALVSRCLARARMSEPFELREHAGWGSGDADLR